MQIIVSPKLTAIFQSVNAVGDTPALIYSDLISPMFVAQSFDRCLRTFIYSTLSGEHIYKNVQYVPVEKQMTTDIRIEVLNLMYNRMKFKSSKTPSKVVLHFRRVPAW